MTIFNIIELIWAELVNYSGTHNWLIALDIRDDIPMVIYSGRPCYASKSVTCGSLRELAGVQRHLFYFSRKADFDKAMNLLKGTR